MLSRDSMGTREIRFTQAEPVGPNKPIKQGWFDGVSEVRLVDSTLRQGEPVTWGSGQQSLNFSKRNMSFLQRKVTHLNSK